MQCKNCGRQIDDKAVICPQCGAQTANYRKVFASQAPESYFDGGLLQLIGWRILGALVTVCTLGICFPWAYCMLYRWEARHTVINGRRLRFTGTAMGLFGSWIKWLLLTLITFGIYGLWVGIKLKKWKVKHTEFEVPLP